MQRLRSESGQVIPFVGILLLTTMIGMCAFAIDFGAWFTASRHAQGVADAAALAAVQDLPSSPADARTDAAAYALSNDGALDGTPAVTTTAVANDTITVKTVETSPAYFARIFGVKSVTLHATASAQAAGVSEIPGQGLDSNGTGRPVPFAIAQGTWTSTPLGSETSLCWGPCNKLGAGEFGLVDFAGGGSHVKDVADWLQNGYPDGLATGTYDGIHGNGGFSANRDLIYALAGQTITLPVYTGSGAGDYDVIGWAAFVVDGVPHAGGDWTQLNGHFISLDVKSTTSPAQYFGVGHVKLTK